MAQEIYHRSEWGNPTEQWGNVYLNADLTNELYKRASEYENSWVTDQLLNGVGIKPSIILTPTAYEDGVLNSVKPAKTFGSELVTNGNFDTDLSGWTNFNNHWQWTSQGAYYPLISTHNPLTQILTNPVGVKLKITFTLNIIQGTAQIYYNNINNSPVSTQYTESGTYTIETELVKQNTDISFSRHAGINTEFYLNNVSVKKQTEADFDFTRGSSATRVNELGLVQDVQLLSGELVQNGNFEQIGSEQVVNGSFDTDSGWAKGTGWSIANGSASYDGSGIGYQYILQSITTTSGSIYKINFDVLSSTGSNLNIVDFGSVRVNQSHLTEGNYTFYAQADSSSENIIIYANGTDTFSIDNVSVKEVGQNWSLEGGWSVQNGLLVNDGTGVNLSATQSGFFTVGNKYRVSLDIKSITQGSLEIYLGFPQSDVKTINSIGSYTYDIIASGNTTFYIKPLNNFIGSIDNISVVEVTDDTDLPRINYTNFDYENGEVVPYSGEGSLLLEPQSTNLVTYSEDFTQWATSGIITIESGYLAPDGSTNAYKITDNAPSNNATALFLVGVATASNSRTIWAKTVSGTGTANLCSHNSNTNNLFTVTNKWQRFEVNGTTSTSGNANFYGIDFRNSGTLDEIIIWGAQSEALSYATSYIVSNSGSTTTRLADLCNNSGNSDLINSTEGVLYFEGSFLRNGRLQVGDGTSANAVVIGYADNPFVRIRANSLNYLTKFGSGDLNTNVKIAISYKSEDTSFWINGVLISENTSAFTFTNPLNEIEFISEGNRFYGNVKCVAVFKETDIDLEKLTTI